MLRALRIIGILVFALLVGISAHRIQKLYTSGKLFEQYNSERKTNVTLLAVSVVGLGLLGFFELTRAKRLDARRGFAPVDDSDEGVDDGLDTANIYSAPETLDKWAGRRIRTSSSRPQSPVRQSENFWMLLLRILSFSTPLLYAGLLVACLSGKWMPPLAMQVPILSSICGFMLIFSLISATGILQKKPWGIKTGYAIAIIHLLFFPVGTAAGLLLLIGLVGAAPLIMLSPHEQRRAARNKPKDFSAA